MKVKKTSKKSTKKKILSQLKKRPSIPWKGPQEEGVSQSMLNLYLYCPERFRIMVIDGWRPTREFNRSIFYGDLWHCCEEAIAGGEDWEGPLLEKGKEEIAKWPESKYYIEELYQLCKMQFPIYLKYWDQEPDVKSRQPIWQEKPFTTSYDLPSGRSVKLRGMYDSVDVIGKSKLRGIFLQENKTRSEIVTEKIARELPNNLQTMLYLSSLQKSSKELAKIVGEKVPIRGVRYNVVKRPLSKGRYCITQAKGRVVNRKGPDGKVLKDADGNNLKTRTGVESKKDFYNRLAGLIQGDPSYFFVRLKCDITESDLKVFQTEVLNPMFDQLCEDYEWWCWCHNKGISQYSKRRKEVYSQHTSHHFRMPYGIYNPIAEGRNDDWNDYITKASTTRMERVEPGSFFSHHKSS